MTNPYNSPQAIEAPHSASPVISIPKAVAVVFGCAVVGSLLGAGLGYALGCFAPGYYRSIFSGGDDPKFDPVAVGLGMGATQGVVGGLVIGLAIVFMVAWFGSRRGPRPVDRRRE